MDLLQLHSCSEELLRKGDVIDVLVRAKKAGKTRYLGYSGDRNNALCAVESGAFDSLQTSLNVADQQAISLTLPKAFERGMGVIAKRPVANAAWGSGDVRPKNPYCHEYWEWLQRLQYPFVTELPLDEAVGLALRFTLSQPGVSVAIVGTKNPSRWASNSAHAAQGPLSASLLRSIRDRWLEVSEPEWVGQT